MDLQKSSKPLVLVVEHTHIGVINISLRLFVGPYAQACLFQFETDWIGL
jgi:hypothetical protein